MTREELTEEVIGIIAAVIDWEPGKIKPESKVVDDLGMDSLDCIEVVMDLEDNLLLELGPELQVDTDKLEERRETLTVSELVDEVETLRAKGKA